MANHERNRKRILFVEDQEDEWGLVAFSLPEYQVVCSPTFEDGLRFARRRYFDLYILDNWLPDGSGIGLCRAIREFDPHTPIVFYSAAAYSRDTQEALRSGAQAYLIKPVSPDGLKHVVTLLVSPARRRYSKAWRAEIAAIQDEFAMRQEENTARFESAKERRQRAEEKLMRLKAAKAFLAAGGSRGEFARRWPSVFIEEVCSHRAGG